jgi:ABC-2 type transport system permease protein
MNFTEALRAMAMLTAREWVRFVRQPSRIVATVGTSLLMWGLLASGFAASFAPPMEAAGGGADGAGGGADGAAYGLHLLPGMIALTVVFSSVFGAISLIDDRNEGFLQSVLVSPTPRWALVGSKLLGGSSIAVVQGLVLVPVVYVMGGRPGAMEIAAAVAALACASVGVTGLGLALAWRVNSVQGFHGVMNLVLMPMWLLAGTLFPIAGASAWLRPVMMADPLTWPLEALRHALTGAEPAAPLWATWALAAGFAMGSSVLAWTQMRVR